MTSIAWLLHLCVLPALLVMLICLFRIKQELYRADFIHSDFEYYFNPFVIFRYLGAQIHKHERLSASLIAFILAATLILADCVVYQLARWMYR